MKNKSTSWLLLPLLLSVMLYQQQLEAQAPLNDECSNATLINDPALYCTMVDGENNVDATASSVPSPACFNTIGNDVWYSFEASTAQLDVIVSSAVFSTLVGPAIALYSGSCPNGLIEIGCSPALAGSAYQELQGTNLTPGQTYYIRVDALIPGDFQLCLHEASIGEEITGDCPTGIVVCDKGQRAVQFVAGPGDDPTEWSDAVCLAGFPGESNTSWFIFTAAIDGTLEFTLTPDNPDDDLDFVVYSLPNGPGDCTGKILERCMVAGNFGAGNPCTGPTGLNATSTDISEPPGCPPGSDNFLKYMDLIAGETYALSVNNFTSSGAGFMIDWGGTVEFEGPAIGILSDPADNVICLGEAIEFSDTIAAFDGFIASWAWTFGANAAPFGDTTQGPHTVQYLNTGAKTIELTVRTDRGCLVKKQLDIQVDSCCAIMASVNVEPSCLPDTTCQQAAAVVTNSIGGIQYNWSTGQTDSIATMLQGGDYSLIVQDAFGCADTVTFTVDNKSIFEIPNAFTPNGDQFNDVFRPAMLQSAVEVLQFQVWNRWGNLVHDDPVNGWDGTFEGNPSPSDVYVYRIKIRWPDGREEVRTKDVTLLR